ncbi:hypothetical protein Hanom_Chr01g00003881 [Helianthus anomalus]
MVGLVLFTYLISEMDLANPLGKDYSMLIIQQTQKKTPTSFSFSISSTPAIAVAAPPPRSCCPSSYSFLLCRHRSSSSSTPTTLLKDKSRMTEGKPDLSQPKIVEEVKSTVRSAVNQVVSPTDVAGPSYQVDLSQIVYQPIVPTSNIPDFQSVLKTHVLGIDLFHSQFK